MTVTRREFLGTMAATLHALSKPAGLMKAAAQAATAATATPLASASTLLSAKRIFSSGSHAETYAETGRLLEVDMPAPPPLTIDQIRPIAANFAKAEQDVSSVLTSPQATDQLAQEWVRESTEGVARLAHDVMNTVQRAFGDPVTEFTSTFSPEEIAAAREEVEATIKEWRETINPNLTIPQRAAQWQERLTRYFHPELAPPKKEEPPRQETKPQESPPVMQEQSSPEALQAPISADWTGHMDAATPPHSSGGWFDRLYDKMNPRSPDGSRQK